MGNRKSGAQLILETGKLKSTLLERAVVKYQLLPYRWLDRDFLISYEKCFPYIIIKIFELQNLIQLLTGCLVTTRL